MKTCKSEINPNLDSLDVMNAAPRCPVVLLLDVSGSMAGQPIAELNAGVRQFIAETQADEAASMSVELEIITISTEAKAVLPFTTMSAVTPPGSFVAGGKTSIGAALNLADKHLSARRELYRANGISSYKPFLILVSDGGPTDGWKAVAQNFRAKAERGGFTFIGVEVGARANHEKMCQIVPAEPGPVKLKGLRFKQFFRWLTDSLGRVSASTVAEQDNVAYGSIGSWADL